MLDSRRRVLVIACVSIDAAVSMDDEDHRLRYGSTARQALVPRSTAWAARETRTPWFPAGVDRAVVLADGIVGEVRVVRSLDKEHGLDNVAVETVKKPLFVPGMRDGSSRARHRRGQDGIQPGQIMQNTLSAIRAAAFPMFS
jgi:hypothetical protein